MPKHKYYWRVEFQGRCSGNWLLDSTGGDLVSQPKKGYDTRKQARHHAKQMARFGDPQRIVKVAR